VCSQVLLMDLLPSSNRVFSMVIQHERQHNLLQHDILPIQFNFLFNSSDNRHPHFGWGRGGGFSARVGSLNGGRSSLTYNKRNSSIKTYTFYDSPVTQSKLATMFMVILQDIQGIQDTTASYHHHQLYRFRRDICIGN